ncbi:MAG: hypothetical protein AAGB15_02190 [Pseudomonadota bacterium]
MDNFDREAWAKPNLERIDLSETAVGKGVEGNENDSIFNGSVPFS